MSTARKAIADCMRSKGAEVEEPFTHQNVVDLLVADNVQIQECIAVVQEQLNLPGVMP